MMLSESDRIMELPLLTSGEVTSNARTLQIAQTIPMTEAEGPGRRFAIWFQGCPLRCPGCCNPEMLRFTGGTSVPLGELLSQIETAAQEHDLEGVTLIGGEPFAHADGAAELAEQVRQRGLTVMIFSGFTVEDLRESESASVQKLLAECDLLVDGPYLREEPETERRWIGSRNQRIHFLSDRYDADDERWRTRNTLEIRMVDGEILINGFPAPEAKAIWQRLVKKKPTDP